MQKFLIIQTSFIGDVVLATAIAEKLHQFFPESSIDFLLRKGNEGLLKNHPFVANVFIWDKKRNKYGNLLRLARNVRAQRYSHVFNLHRFAASGFITLVSGASHRIGYRKNPFSFCYTAAYKHEISDPYAPRPIHETLRNQNLIASLTDEIPALPRLYPSQNDFEQIARFIREPYICIAPSSVWFTKQFPADKWVALTDALSHDLRIFLLGGAGDESVAQSILSKSNHPYIQSLCGQLSFLESAALMQHAVMNYVNDSAPLHFASAVNAPVTAVFCSTVPAFGFGPLSENARVVEIKERLYCRPCGLHGYAACPEKHFRCAWEIETQQLLWWTSKTT